jgi:DNA-binding transcriptional LysR family regulator
VEAFDIECFVALADELHFGRASKRLQIGTSAISKRIADLERQWQVRLFDRTSRRVRLTPAGAELLGQAKRALAEIHGLTSLAERAAVGAVGGLRIVYSPGTGEMMTILSRRLRELDDGIGVFPEQMLSLRILDAIEEGTADLGISRVHPGPKLATIELAASPVTTVVMPLDHRLVEKDSIDLDDLAGETLIGSPASLNAALVGSDRIELTSAGRVLQPEVSTEGEIYDLVAAGFGLRLTTAASVRRNQRNDIRTRPLTETTVVEHTYLMWRPDDPSSLVRRAVTLVPELRPMFDQLANS